MTTYTMNVVLFTRTDGATSSPLVGSSVNHYFRDFVPQESKNPSEILVNISIYTGLGSTTYPAYSVVKMISEDGTVLSEHGIYQETSANRDFRIPVPPGTAYFKCEARVYGVYAGRFVYNGNTKVTLKEMTYSTPVAEPKVVEISVTTSVTPFVTSIRRAFETVKSATIQAIKTKTTVEVQTNSYSHIEPLHTAVTRRAITVTSTKGNKISTIAFTNVKTTTSSLVKPIGSHSKLTFQHSRTVTSVIKDISTRSERTSSAVRQVNSYMEAAKSTSEARFFDSKFVKNIKSHVKPISSKSVAIPVIKLTMNDKSSTEPAMNMKYKIGGSGQGGDSHSYTYIPVAFTSGRIKQALFAVSVGTSRGGTIEVGYAYSNTDQPTTYESYSATAFTNYMAFIEDIPDDVQYLVLRLAFSGVSSGSVYAAPIEFGVTTRTLKIVDRAYYKLDATNRHITLGFDVQAPFHAYMYPVTSRNTIDNVDEQLYLAKEGAAEYTLTNEVNYGDDVTGTQRFYTRQMFSSLSTLTRNAFTFIEELPVQAVAERAIREVTTYVSPITSDVKTLKSGRSTVSSQVAPISTSVSKELIVHAKSFLGAHRSSVEHVRSKTVVLTSSVQRISSRATVHKTKDILVSSYASAIQTNASIARKREVVVASVISPIVTNASSSGNQIHEVIVRSEMFKIGSEVKTSKSKIISTSSYAKQIVSRTDISHSSKRDVIVTTSIKKLATDVLRAAEVHSESSVRAIHSEVVVQVKRLPRKQTRIVTSSVGRIASRAKLEKEVILRSYIEPSFSKALSSCETSVISSVSNIKSGVVVSRTRRTVVVTVGSLVRPLRHDIIVERRKLKMRLNELKIRLQIPAEDTSNDDLLLVLLDDAIDFVQRACNQVFDPMPPTAKKVVAQYVSNELAGNRHIRAEWIADMKQEFESSEERDKALTNILRKSGLIKLRFAPLGGR